MKNLNHGGWVLLVCMTFASAFAVSRSYGAGCPGSGQQSVGPDVICGGVGVSGTSGSILNDFANVNTAVIGGVTYDSFAMATTSCNVGDQPLPWFDPDVSTDHPVISQNFFRFKSINGSRRFEQLAQSWVKHGFCSFSENLCCATCTPFGDAPCGFHTYLGVGCSDPYTGSRNGQQQGPPNGVKGPKWQINATTGVNQSPIANPSGSLPSVARRLHIKVSDLEVSDGNGDVNATRYFGECMYIHPDDGAAGNKNNNASYRAIATTNPGSLAGWRFLAAFPATNTTHQMQPGIRAWSDTDTTATIPGTITRVVETDVVTPEDAGYNSLVIVAAQATKLGNGYWHYEYAVENLNSDRSVASFSIPVSRYANVNNLGFRDVDYWDGDGVGNVTTDGTDWPASIGNDSVSWTLQQTYAQNVNANALRWGTMYNFRFDCDIDPAMSGGDVALIDATMSQFKPNAVNFTGGTVAPASVTCLRGDLNNDGLIDGNDIVRFSQILVNGNLSATPRERCAGDLAAVPDNVIGADDIDNFSNCLLAGGGC